MFVVLCFFFFKQKTAYEMRISDWSSDVCSSDLIAPHALRPGIGFDQRDPFFGAAGEAQIIDRRLIDREEAAGCAIFGRHVSDGRAVRQRQASEAGAVEFDEAAEDALGAENLRPCQQLTSAAHRVGKEWYSTVNYGGRTTQ